MSVEIEPQELGFHRPFTVEVLENLKIRNPGSQPVAFKVKTTAPKQYCVRPNSGRVEPNREVEVQVILQALKQEPPPGTKCRDKFLVQSVAITPDKDFANLASIWDTIDKSTVQEKKIRVTFLDPKNSPTTDATVSTPNRNAPTNGIDATPDTAPPTYASPSDGHGRSEPKPSVEEGSHPEVKPSLGTPLPVTAAAKTSEPSRDELKEQLLQAEKTIAQLKKDDGGLRQRKAGTATAEKSSAKPAELAQAARAGTEGVPVQITAILCLVSFLLAYIFF